MSRVEVVDIGGRLDIGEMIIRVERIYGLKKADIWLAGFCSGVGSMVRGVDEGAKRDALAAIEKIGKYCGLTPEQRAVILRNLPPSGEEGDGRT